MATLAATTTVTTTTEVKLRPSVRQLLLTELQAYAKAFALREKYAAEVATHTANIRSIREETGETSLELEGFKTGNQPGQTSYLDKQLFVELGGSLEQLANATRSKPKKSYERVTCPGERERSYED